MIDTEFPANSEPTPLPFEPGLYDDYSQYLLYSRSEILAVFRALIQKNCLITIHFDHGNSFLLTSMIALSNDGVTFTLDMGSNDEMNRKALLADKLICTAIVDKVKIQFSLESISLTRHEGRTAFLAAVPDTLLRLQRREYFRLATPIANRVNLIANVRRPDGSKMAIEVPLLDISGGGVGLMATPNQAELFQRGDTLSGSKISLPEEGVLITTLCVRNKFDVTTRSGSRHVRIGCEFVELPPARMTMVQRYITRIERERKARLSGMA